MLWQRLQEEPASEVGTLNSQASHPWYPALQCLGSNQETEGENTHLAGLTWSPSHTHSHCSCLLI